jgi:hypothetical protein
MYMFIKSSFKWCCGTDQICNNSQKLKLILKLLTKGKTTGITKVGWMTSHHYVIMEFCWMNSLPLNSIWKNCKFHGVCFIDPQRDYHQSQNNQNKPIFMGIPELSFSTDLSRKLLSSNFCRA